MGQIAQFRVFNRSLSIPEMNALYGFRGDVPSSAVVAAECPAGYACAPNNTRPTACAAGSYAPEAYAWTEQVPLQTALLSNLILSSLWDVSFDLMLLSFPSTGRTSILGLASATHAKLLTVNLPPSFMQPPAAGNAVYIEMGGEDAAGEKHYPLAGGYGPLLTLDMWTRVTCSRRGSALLLYYNGTYIDQRPLPNTSNVDGVSLLVGNPYFVSTRPMTNCSI